MNTNTTTAKMLADKLSALQTARDVRIPHVGREIERRHIVLTDLITARLGDQGVALGGQVLWELEKEPLTVQSDDRRYAQTRRTAAPAWVTSLAR